MSSKIIMKIVIFCPKAEFDDIFQRKLNSLGRVIYTRSRREYSLNQLIKLSRGAEVVGFDPDNFGGIEESRKKLPKLIKAVPSIKGIALSTTAFDYVDLEYCRKHNIVVINIPKYSTESIAEHAIALLSCLAKRIIVNGCRQGFKRCNLKIGFELKGKTLGVIGLGNVGSRVAELGNALGMKVIAFNRTPKKRRNVKMKSLDDVLADSDAISIHLAVTTNTKNIISKDMINKIRKGAVIVNIADRVLVDETAMAKALKLGKVDNYLVEVDDITSSPLRGLKNAFLMKRFGWFTKEALDINKQIWVKNIVKMAKTRA